MSLKKIKSLVVIPLGMLIFSNCVTNEGEKVTPASKSVVTYSPVVNYNLKDRHAPFVYRGDTVRYRIHVNAQDGLKEIQLMELINNIPTENGVFSKITEFDSDTAHVLDFIYVADDTVTNTFFVKVTEKNNAVNINNINSLGNPVLRVSAKDVEEYKGWKLFNSIGRNANGFTFKLNSTIGDSPYPTMNFDNFIYNTTNYDNPENASFIRGWTNYNENGSKFVKIQGFDIENCTANQIQSAFLKNSGNVTNKVTNVQVGDVYAIIMYDYKSSFPADVDPAALPWRWSYGILKVTGISDDLKTTEEGGDDDDYIQMDIKAFNNVRFKQ